MLKPFCKQFTGTAGWVALSSTYLAFQGRLLAAGGTIQIRIGTDATTETTLLDTQFFDVLGCDISKIQIRGNTFVLKAFGVTVPSGW